MLWRARTSKRLSSRPHCARVGASTSTADACDASHLLLSHDSSCSIALWLLQGDATLEKHFSPASQAP
eukprot:scaffold736_cov254-Pinguiococcus_pyrenoidosus.AAC.8